MKWDTRGGEGGEKGNGEKVRFDRFDSLISLIGMAREFDSTRGEGGRDRRGTKP